ncbi:MAG TPA: hypothetical protein VK699_17485 [Terriglobales bacterium]|jgi:hypothetical protein|nr:hypothetical protein [Terriglobales bacterium]
MKLRIASVVSVLLASAVLGYSLPNHGGAGGGGHVGGGASGTGHTGMEHSGTSTSSHSTQSGSQAQSQTSSPKQLSNPNSKLSSNLQKLLPAGTTPQQACSGFKNLGQCVAAIHVSHNLGIPFSDLKSKLTGPNSESLGKAIKALKPNSNSTAETKKAEKQAQNDIESES